MNLHFMPYSFLLATMVTAAAIKPDRTHMQHIPLQKQIKVIPFHVHKDQNIRENFLRLKFQWLIKEPSNLNINVICSVFLVKFKFFTFLNNLFFSNLGID